MKLLLIIFIIFLSATIGFIQGLRYNTMCTIEVNDVNHKVSLITKRCHE